MTTISNFKGISAKEKVKFQEQYDLWMCNRTQDEIELYDLIIEYDEKLFKDFTFQRESLITPFLKGKTKVNGKWVTFYENPHEAIESITDSLYRFLVADLEDAEGLVKHPTRTMTIPLHNLGRKDVILHEMIHIYEDVLHPMYKEILQHCLYVRLSKKIPDLDTHILERCNLAILHENAIDGGYHGPLFHLKSLDLDCRCRFNLGTVFGGKRIEEQG